MVPRCQDDLCGPHTSRVPDAVNRKQHDNMLYRVIHQACSSLPPFFPFNNAFIQILLFGIFKYLIYLKVKSHNIFEYLVFLTIRGMSCGDRYKL